MDGSVSIDASGRVTGVHFRLEQPEVSFARAWDLLFDPDTAFDEEDGLMMFTELDRTGRLSAVQRGRLRTRLRERTSPFLVLNRKACWDDLVPPDHQFWWFRPGDWNES